MNDPLDTVEAILDQHPADWRDWTVEDLRANEHVIEVLMTELEAAEADRFRDQARWQRVLALNERALKAGYKR